MSTKTLRRLGYILGTLLMLTGLALGVVYGYGEWFGNLDRWEYLKANWELGVKSSVLALLGYAILMKLLSSQ